MEMVGSKNSSFSAKHRLPQLKKAEYYSIGGIMGTPPHQTIASIPFEWEEKPGKPRSTCTCTTIIPFNNPTSLQLPPRLLGQNSSSSSPSPVTVLDGPYYMGRSKFTSSSFRMFKTQASSFDSNGPDHDFGASFHYYQPNNNNLKKITKGIFGWKRKNKSNLLKKNGEIGSISFGYGSSSSSSSSSMEKTNSFWTSEEVNGSRRISKNGSFTQTTSAQFWAAMYDGIKQVIPWKSKKI